MSEAPRPPDGWHLDRRVPIAFLLAIVVQTGAVLVWAGGVSERIGHLERQMRAATGLVERTARLEEQVSYMRATLERIDAKLDRRQQALRPPG